MNLKKLLSTSLLLLLLIATGFSQTTVTATVYNAVVGQTDSTPLITASGAKINPDAPQRWIAVSRDLEPMGYTFGTQVCVENAGEMNGIWTVQDRMNKRWTLRIDFLVHRRRDYGKWEDVKIRACKN